MTSPLRVAVATKNKVQIDEHFGHADEFKIYLVGPEGPVLEEVRLVEHYCQGGYGDEDKREVILRALADCQALFVAKVGDGPAQRLRDAGIAPIGDYAYGAIDASLMDWYRKQAAA
ncbi:MAG TPA: NifB/NifX family molybdenum-iron cluster-binding protein [Rhodocyclaceae bacterium]|jgi:nitrogen fixation protein NifB|nr:NifB/NifX family molybdenum-iron cluster-binding protein [Rhodocyclaceae bacterium]